MKTLILGLVIAFQPIEDRQVYVPVHPMEVGLGATNEEVITAMKQVCVSVTEENFRDLIYEHGAEALYKEAGPVKALAGMLITFRCPDKKI